MSLSVIMIGTGAIAGFYGGKLAQSGAQVSYWARSDADIIRKNGFSIQSSAGDFSFYPHEVVTNLSELSRKPDVVMVCLKALPTIELEPILLPLLKEAIPVVLLQNGIGIEFNLAARYPNTEWISGLAFVCANRIGPGVIRHLDYGRVVLGRYPTGISPIAEQLAHLLIQSGIDCRVSTIIQKDRWKKLVWNAAFNPISVLAGGVTTADILTNPLLANLARQAMEDVVALAAADGHPLAPNIVDQNIVDTQKMAPYKTSMLLDFEAGRPMEIEAILGNAIQIGAQHHVETPTLSVLYALLSSVNTKQMG